MVDTFYPGANPLESAAIREVVGFAMDAPAKAKSGHTGTAMALAPLGVALFSRVMRHWPGDAQWLDRDRFVLSVGHTSILQYGLAHVFGYDVSVEQITNFRQPQSGTPGHPEVGVTPTVEVSTGPLGQGFANAVGLALAERFLRTEYGEAVCNHHTWVVVGDGCLEEGISHEAASLAGLWGLGNLTVFYDDNDITIDGHASLSSKDNVVARFEAYGWEVIDIGENANNLDEIELAANASRRSSSQPTLIRIRSHIAYPSPVMQDKKEAHGTPFTSEMISQVKDLLGMPQEPFAHDVSLPEKMRASLTTQKNAYDQWKSQIRENDKQTAAFLEQMRTNGAANEKFELDFYDDASPVATRKAMQRFMDGNAQLLRNGSSGSADLTENTGVVLPATSAMSSSNPGNRQVYYGIREHAMAAIMVGQALHGGIRPVGSTFFVFSDYMKPAIRMSALTKASTLFIFTHDSIGVGEDGPTHQPIEHLAALRAIPHLHTVRPSDANEAMRFAADFMEAVAPPPTALVLTRQDIPVLVDDEATASRNGYRKGAYVLRECLDADITLMATGSEVSLALGVSDALSSEGITSRTVAMPCWSCFDATDESYRRTVLGNAKLSISIEAASTFGWHRFAEHAIGIDVFGESAPGSWLFKHYGFSVDQIVGRIKNWLGEIQ